MHLLKEELNLNVLAGGGVLFWQTNIYSDKRST